MQIFDHLELNCVKTCSDHLLLHIFVVHTHIDLSKNHKTHVMYVKFCLFQFATHYFMYCRKIFVHQNTCFNGNK